MLEKGKKYVKKHKTELIIGGCIAIAGVLVGMKFHGALNGRVIAIGESLRGKEWISWTPGAGSRTLDSVKEILDLNADNNAMYAIFREGLEPDSYICILMDDKFVIPDLI